MRKADEIFQAIEENKKDREFLKTGITKLDNDLDGGFLRKEIVILGAFTGIGKSMFAGQIFQHIASEGFQSAYFSLEISSEVILARLAGQIADIKPNRILNGFLDPVEIDLKAQAKAKIVTYNELMHFYDDLYLLGEIHKAILENKYEFVVIDFIQNILLDNQMDEYARLTFIAVQLQKLAKEANCCILVLSQLSNRVGNDNKKLVEYKGSGAVAQIADLGFFLERGEPILDINGQPTGNQPVTLVLRKNRRGIAGLFWNLEFAHPGGLIKGKL